MKGKFNTIKKSRKKSKDIDEKIEYLNKECQKTGLQEFMTTSNVYQGTAKEPNETYNEFTALNFNGLALGLSGVKGSAGGATVGTVEAGMRHGASRVGAKGIAISPPHPVTGVRQLAMTRTGGIASGGDFSPAKPGQKQGNSDYPTGAIMWFWDPNFLNGDGLWRYFEYDVAPGKWGWWDSNFMGFGFLNHNLDQFPMSSGSAVWTTSLANTINGLKVDSNGEIGTPQTTVLTKNDLDDPSFIPIDIGGLSQPGYDYLKNKAEEEFIAGTYDLMKSGQVPFLTPEQVNKILVDPKFQQLLQDDPDLLPILQRMRAMGDDGTDIASIDPSTIFPTSPSNNPTDSNTNQGEGPKPPKATGADVKLGQWMDRNEFTALYPDSDVEEYLSALPYGAMSFLKPDPNFPGARNVDTEAYERYFLTGDTSGLSSDAKPRHTETPEVEYTPQELKTGFSTGQILNYLKTKFSSPLGPATDIIADIVADTFGQRGAKAILDDYTRNFIPDLFSGKNVAGKTSGNPRNVGNMFSNKSIKDFEKVYNFHKTTVKPDGTPYEDDTLRWKTDYQKISDANSEIGNTFGTFGDTSDGADQFVDNGDGTETLIKRYDFDRMGDMAGSNAASTLGAMTYGILSGIPFLLGKGEGGKTPSAYIGITFDKNTGKVIKNYKKGIAESLDESVKLGHFEPEVLNVNIEKLRKGILPEFPKNPPPKLINGYSEKSKLAPKTIEGEPFLNVTKKDLAKNHLFTDKEINKYMDEINAINNYIRKNPAELIYAMQRYPKDDPRLAQLNWQMDQRMKASEDYMETHFPENERLFNKLQAKIKQNIELTNPKNFTGHAEAPKFIQNNITEQERRRKTIIRHFKKKK